MNAILGHAYVAFPSLHETPLTIAARLSLPVPSGAKAPAVVILHGSAGPSMREVGYAAALRAAGFVTLELDQWAARGLGGGDKGRPKTFTETLPDVFGALAFLGARPEVDPARIGLLGFSFGGVATMLCATRAHSGRFAAHGQFAAFMPVYPACWTYNTLPGQEFSSLTGAPLLLVTGALDEYDDDAEAGPKLAASLAPEDRAHVRTHVFADAHHGFDMPGIDVVVPDPFCHRGKGGHVVMRHNPDAAREAHRLAVSFFRETLG
jgi:dienelactone hydrolase